MADEIMYKAKSQFERKLINNFVSDNHFMIYINVKESSNTVPYILTMLISLSI